MRGGEQQAGSIPDGGPPIRERESELDVRLSRPLATASVRSSAQVCIVGGITCNAFWYVEVRRKPLLCSMCNRPCCQPVSGASG